MGHVACALDGLAVFVEDGDGGELSVGVVFAVTAEDAEEVVEAVFERVEVWAVAEVPLAEDGGGVASVF